MRTAAARGGTADAIVLAGPPAGPPSGRAAFDPAWARVAGRPGCVWAVDTLDTSQHIRRVALVVEARRLAAARRLIAAAGWRAVHAVAPSEDGTDARGLVAWLGAGLAALDEARAEAPAGAPGAVVLHEGSRPLLPTALLDALFAAWDGASVLAAASPVKETLKAVDTRRRVRQTPPRDHLWQLHPPLLLPCPLLERIIVAATPPDARVQGQPDASLTALIARAPGVRLRLVAAGHEDVVLRRSADARLAEGMLTDARSQ
jgi:2-C-methyl-D-erythritol 4-phosphate cytidylyltransferase